MCFLLKSCVKLTGCLSAFNYWNTINTQLPHFVENLSNWFRWKSLSHETFSTWLMVFLTLPLFFLFTELSRRKMQVESNSLHDRARLFARIPPCIDLSAVTNCASETEKRWKSINQNGSNFNKPLHVKTSNIENATVVKMGPDDLPIGKLLAICLLCVNIPFNVRFYLFLDPRDWTRQEVMLWILNLGKSEGIDAHHIADKFKMNGKALCLMSVEMFLSRFPGGGKMLYRDFRLRLTRALSLWSW